LARSLLAICDRALRAPPIRFRVLVNLRLPLPALFALAGLLSLAMLAPAAHAANRYGNHSGLPSAQVQALAIDERGYLWVGTQDGLVRFDSHRFLPIEIEAGEAVPDAEVRQILAVPGAVYLSTSRRLLRFDLQRETLQPLRLDGADIGSITGLVRDLDGSLVAATSQGELLRWRDEVAVPQRLALELPEPIEINDLAVGRDGLWIATMRGVLRLARGSLAPQALAMDLPELDGGRVHVSAVHEDALGRLWVGFWNDGLARHDLASGRTHWLHPKLGNAGALRSTSIYSFLERGERLYIGSNRGLVVYGRDCDCIRGLNLPEWEVREGSGVVVMDLVAEPEGDGLWVGVWGGGLARFSAFDEAIERQVPIDGRSDSLAHPMVYSMLVDSERRLWIGTYGGGVHGVDPQDRRLGLHWPLQRLDFGQRRIESRFVWHLREQAQGMLVGSGYGLFRHAEGALHDLAPGLQSLRSSLELGDGRLLIGTGFGLFEMRGTEPPQRVDRAGLGQRTVWSLQRVGDEVWVGTSQGLQRLDLQLQPLGTVQAGAGADSLPGPVVWTQKFGPDGRLWLGTSGGLLSLEAGTQPPRFERHPGLQTVGVRNINAIEFGPEGSLWLGSPRGLLHYRPGQQTIELLDDRDGLVSTQLNANASASDGERLYFGGIGGFVGFDPRAMPARDLALRPAVVSWRLGQGDWQPANGHIDLGHDHAPLQLELSAFHFARPERVRYAYRWLPDEAEFTELGDAHSAVFSHLPAGAHRLELRASLLGPVPASVQREVFSVQVAPVWFATWWGMGLIGGSLLLLWMGFHRLRLRQARRYARGLEREVDQRTRELSEAKRALEQANAQLSAQVALDPLTGLANRRGLLEAAAALAAQRATPQLLMIDLDHFKRINDGFGHEVGDAVLVDFARLLHSQVRRDCVCARYGGEEFVVLMREVDAKAVDALAERLVRASRKRALEHEGLFKVRYTISIGIALGTAGEPAMALIQRADRALYRAKAAGRDCWMRED
jgi:diguanylate cyclase (GGDEF)-like protein